MFEMLTTALLNELSDSLNAEFKQYIRAGTAKNEKFDKIISELPNATIAELFISIAGDGDTLALSYFALQNIIPSRLAEIISSSLPASVKHFMMLSTDFEHDLYNRNAYISMLIESLPLTVEKLTYKDKGYSDVSVSIELLVENPSTKIKKIKIDKGIFNNLSEFSGMVPSQISSLVVKGDDVTTDEYLVNFRLLPSRYLSLEVVDCDFSYYYKEHFDSDYWEITYYRSSSLTIKQLFEVYLSIPMTVTKVKLTHQALSDIELIEFYVLACQQFMAIQDVTFFLNRIESMPFKSILPLNLTKKFPIQDKLNIIGLLSDLLKWLKNSAEPKSNLHLLFHNPTELLVSSNIKQNAIKNAQQSVRDLMMALVPFSQLGGLALGNINSESDVIYLAGQLLKKNNAYMQMDSLKKLKSIFVNYLNCDLTTMNMSNEGVELVDYSYKVK